MIFSIVRRIIVWMQIRFNQIELLFYFNCSFHISLYNFSISKTTSTNSKVLIQAREKLEKNCIENDFLPISINIEKLNICELVL